MNKQLALAVLATRLSEGCTEIPGWTAARMKELTRLNAVDQGEIDRLEQLSLADLAKEVVDHIQTAVSGI